MIINKHLEKKVLKNYLFIKGKIQIDSDYFINEIQTVCKSEKNLNYKTNINGLMTKFKHFNGNQKFLDTLEQFINYIDSNFDFPKYHCADSWGFEVRPKENTFFHDHSGSHWSGVIYLNECNQPLIFPEINEELKPEKGAFALFSSFLNHGCEKNTDTVSKFGLSFNMGEHNQYQS